MNHIDAVWFAGLVTYEADSYQRRVSRVTMDSLIVEGINHCEQQQRNADITDAEWDLIKLVTLGSWNNLKEDEDLTPQLMGVMDDLDHLRRRLENGE